MRDFTPEEKELIINTRITEDCFDVTDVPLKSNLRVVSTISIMLEDVRREYLQTKDEQYFIELVHLLPNSYKVVKL